MGKERGESRERSRGLLTVLPGLCTDEAHGARIWVLVFFEPCTFPSPAHSPGSWTTSLQAKMVLWSYRDGTSSQTEEEKSPPWRKGWGLNILQALSRVCVSPWGSHLLSLCWGYKGFLLGTCVYLCVLKSWTRLGDRTTASTKLSCSVMSDSLWSHELWLSRLVCPWDFPGKNPGVGCHFFL